MELLVRINRQEIVSLVVFFGGPFTGGEREGNTLKFPWYGHPIGITTVLLLVVILGVSSWIVANRMRRRINADLGKAADEGDLSSIETWMKVDEVEQKKNPGREWAPESNPSDYESTKHDL